MKYNKLVRDKIPEIIKKNGKFSIIHTASEEEYWKKLKEKLEEEIKEFLEEENEEELADVMEVIHAICDVKNFSMKEIETMRLKKAEERGRFKKKIILDETE